jgi:preprotein translocase subunit SecA
MAMLTGLLTKVLGDPNEKELNRLRPFVEEINGLEPEMQKLSDQGLCDLTEEFRARIRAETARLRGEIEARQQEARGEADPDYRQRLEAEIKELDEKLREQEERLLWEILPRAYAAVREAARRTIGLRPYDVQIIGGIVLHEGKAAEMKTGEGKTLVATLPLYLNALVGRGAHLVTPNDYLSKVGVQWMGPVYHLMGLSVGVIQSAAADPNLGSFLFDPDYQHRDDRYQRLRPVSRRQAYEADITYGTNNEFGFDYLRDNMVWDLSQCVQRELHYAIVDEVDNILIDEARTPLIISGQAEESSDNYIRFANLVRELRTDRDYTVEEKTRSVVLTDEGIAKIERLLGVDNLYSPEHAHLTPYLDNALRAQVIYGRDRDYILKDGQVIIVDEFTGRLMYGRRYSEGLHQAIEAKEGVKVQRENLTLATITFQNYFRMYHKLAGMTGTAYTEAEEFAKIYNLDVVVIPTHKPMIRVNYPDLVYKNEEAKYRAVVREISELHKMGRPVLVGTVSVENSEMLAEMLQRKGIPHQVLNAKQHEKEATIIAQAGRPGTVTIATNMAGRGVDILLGGNPEGLVREELRRQGVDLTTIRQDEWNQALKMANAGQDPTSRFPTEWAQVLMEAVRACERDHEGVVELGGLHILGTERHEARRIDNQLRGRAGRQGDPGSSRFYVSLEDDLMRRFGGERVKSFMEWAGLEDDVPIEHNMITKSIENAQVKVEGYNFDLRKHLLEYDDVINKQREVIYAQRRLILSAANLRENILGMVKDALHLLAANYLASRYREDWDLAALLSAARAIMPLPASMNPAQWRDASAEEIERELLDWAERLYEDKERALGSETMRQLERLVMLRAVDTLWVRHLTELDTLREGIGLRAYGQQDPLISFKKEAHILYDNLTASIQENIVHTIYHVSVVQQPQHRGVRAVHPGGDGQGARQPVPSGVARVGRNDPCPCGSGKKYKHCCMRKDIAAGAEVASAAEPAPSAAAGATPAGQSHKRSKRRRHR